MITPVNRMRRRAADLSRRCCLLLMLSALGTAPAYGHDFERTRVVLTFSRDGSFVLDVTNDLSWLAARLPPFAAGERDLAALGNVFRDRVVLFVDGHEVRPAWAEFVPPGPQTATLDEPVLATYRLRGRLPARARTLRWYYGLVVDPYPFTVRNADGRAITETVYGDAWSGSLEIGPFEPRWHIPGLDAQQLPVMTMVVMIALALALRTTKISRLTKTTKEEI
jgi:hypothetical protein